MKNKFRIVLMTFFIVFPCHSMITKEENYYSSLESAVLNFTESKNSKELKPVIFIRNLINKQHKDNLNQTFMHHACAQKPLLLVEKLIELGGNIYQKDNNGITPLDVALYAARHDIVLMLLKKNPSMVIEANKINLQNSRGKTLLMSACQGGLIEVVQTLIKKGADPTLRSIRGLTAFFYAIESRNVDLLDYLVKEAKIDVNEKIDNKITPLHYAVVLDSVTIVEHLITLGAKVDKEAIFYRNNQEQDSFRLNPILMAIYFEKDAVINYFIQLLESNNELAENLFMHPIHFVCAYGLTTGLKTIIASSKEKEKLLSLYDKNGFFPLYIAAKYGFDQILAILLQEGAPLDQAHLYHRNTALHQCCLNGDINIVRLLINKDARLNVINFDGFTPFYYACGTGNLDLVKLFFEKKYRIEDALLNRVNDVNYMTPHGLLPIYAACSTGNLELVKLLLQNNAVVSDSSSLFFACSSGNIDLFYFLVNRKKMDPYSKDRFHNTIFHMGAKSKNLSFMKYLLKNFKEIDINAENIEGKTALHVACWEGNPDIIRVLLKYGANPNLKSRFKFDPKTMLISNGHSALVKILEENNN